MKMVQQEGDVISSGAGRTVVVGVKLDTHSRELLTWALVKVAQPGDTVIALHVLANNAIVDRDGKSSLLSLVKAFDSVLAVYEGFCNLKQVDLKLKICRGTSIRKILVREAQSYSATKFIYCAKKLSKDCSVLAVNNGKVVFQKEGCPSTADCSGSAAKRNCSICGPVRNLPDGSCSQSEEESPSDGGAGDESLAIVPVQNVEAASTSITMLVRQLPESRPGWPLLRRAIFPDCRAPDRSSLRKISVVQWALRLPTRQPSYLANSDVKQITYDPGDNESINLNGDSGAIVPVGNEIVSSPLSTDHDSTELPKELEGLHEKYSATCRLFNYQDLLSATSNFLAENLIGKGGSSQVYKGCLPDGKELAVKILKPSEDVIKEFVLEIEIITTLHHKNIISLLGFCFEDNNLLLVYDFLSRGSLEENLHGNKKDPAAFGWSERYKVAMGVAEALEYLHSGSAQRVIHRDVKSSNILLSDDFEPQYFMYGKVNDKIDVYAFGVVLLELLTGRKPISNDHPKGQESLVMWAKPILSSGKVTQLLDPALGNNYDYDQMERMVLASILCIRRDPRARPQMSLVLKLLRGDADVTKWARLQVNASEESEMLDDESCPRSNLQSHLNLALLDVEDDSFSMSSIEQSVSLEDYLLGRWSRSSSFD
ncbi:protein kinase domain-containing protein [Citrus sinensis]|nr:protein kinase domain-containing protein [Citrus sinensis]